MDADDPLVQLLVDRVVVDGGLQRGDRLVGVVGFEDLGDAGLCAQELVAVGGGVVGGPGPVLGFAEVAAVAVDRLL